jgi:copper chaperone CopZ
MMNTNTIYTISGLTCNNCVAKVQAALVPFADKVEVTLDPPQVKLTGQKVAVAALNATLSKIGKYQMSDTNLNVPIETNAKPSFLSTYKPLLLVFAYILLVCFAIEMANSSFNLHRFMPNFMAGFFWVFSFFKLLDLAGFASSYAMYDVIAKRFPIYGFIYPFIEAGLAAAYILAPSHAVTSSITLIVMLVSLIGVVQAVLSRQKIKCACLGTGFNLPMSTVTIVEDVLMAGMAAWMLI